jgi:hypothetical protein
VRLPILKAAISNQPAYNGAVFCSSFACAIHLKEGGRVDLEQKNWTELFEINDSLTRTPRRQTTAASRRRGKCTAMAVTTVHEAANANPSTSIGRSMGM